MSEVYDQFSLELIKEMLQTHLQEAQAEIRVKNFAQARRHLELAQKHIEQLEEVPA